MHSVRHLIGGRWSTSSETRTTRKPTDLSDFAKAPVGTGDDVASAVRAARAAFTGWNTSSLEQRLAHIQTLVTELRNAYGQANEPTELKSIVMDEIGKPLPEADIEVLECADFGEFFVRESSSYFQPQAIQINAELWPDKRSYSSFKPYGVVGIIKPWNYPIEMIAWSLFPALCGGNTVVIKPSEKSPVSAYKLAELVKRSSIPDGVVNFVFGDGETGAALVSHPDVQMISFTGSVAVGRKIAVACAQQLKKVSLELGGNDAAIVDNSVDIELSSNGLIWGAFCNAGQVCVGVKRAYVASDIFDELKSKIVDKVSKLRAGVDYGPIIDEQQLAKFSDYINTAQAKGAKLVAGGSRLPQGTYFSPTVLEVDASNDKIFEDECFGPLLPLIRVTGVDQAIELANDSQFGLGASIWVRGASDGRLLAQRLEVGMVWVNDVNVAFPEAAWGGVKQSGIGFELSRDALSNYAYRQHVSVDESSDNRRFWWYPY